MSKREFGACVGEAVWVYLRVRGVGVSERMRDMRLGKVVVCMRVRVTINTDECIQVEST